MTDEEIDGLEQFITEQIRAIQREHEKQLAPYVERLSMILSLRRPKIILPLEQVVSSLMRGETPR